MAILWLWGKRASFPPPRRTHPPLQPPAGCHCPDQDTLEYVPVGQCFRARAAGACVGGGDQAQGASSLGLAFCTMWLPRPPSLFSFSHSPIIPAHGTKKEYEIGIVGHSMIKCMFFFCQLMFFSPRPPPTPSPSLSRCHQHVRDGRGDRGPARRIRWHSTCPRPQCGRRQGAPRRSPTRTFHKSTCP